MEKNSTWTLSADLLALLSSGKAADITIMADGVWLPAHRAVLAARSPVFAAMFRHDVLEASEGSVNIADINQEVLQQLLQFMYTDEAPLLECVAPELLAAAEKYSVTRLKQQCEQQVIMDLCVENAAASAVLAMVYSCAKLKAAAISFINSHFQEVMATDGWASAMREHTENTVEICRLLRDAKRLESECKNETPEKTEEDRGDLAGDLVALLESADSSDVTLMVGEVSLAAHRAVLTARSPVLAEKLKDTPNGTLQMDGAPHKELGEALLYMYSDQLPYPESVSDKLLVLADNYELRVLKKYCEEQLADQISVNNAVSLVVVATKHSCAALKRACVDFIRREIFDVMDTAGWELALRNDLEIMVEICKCVASAQRYR
ncbi:TD and POZ domain-containing protein 1-like [Schistocerca gregaria]|uniref:TD and POZ domain-containing protein 1-like n=1 Tax=Schistocerca gregaria TaxID=7010 RepID=UPI00211E9574|nr:TD and POZ domain-containing protein 1-like [Schistocerca gregaria]